MEKIAEKKSREGSVSRSDRIGWLRRLSFRTGVIVLAACIPFYVLAFAQMALPIDAALKGVLWVVFFGLAKTSQYAGLTILGAEGWRRLKGYFKRRAC